MKPAWLDKKINLGACSRLKTLLRGLHVETVCEQAMCPNMGECFSRSQATFLILGTHCTRGCAFCNIDKSAPDAPDPKEPARVAEAVKLLGLAHVVITSVTRDDLPDGGASAFARTVAAVRQSSPETAIEILIPDLSGDPRSLRVAAQSSPDIIAHNVETVPSLYPKVRQGADYRRSLAALKLLKDEFPSLKTKSGLMLGMGETHEEVVGVMRDLRAAGCDYLSIGQYLAPSSRHYPVQEYIRPEEFAAYRQEAEGLGFCHTESAPYVRSSYHAREYGDVSKRDRTGREKNE